MHLITYISRLVITKRIFNVFYLKYSNKILCNPRHIRMLTKHFTMQIQHIKFYRDEKSDGCIKNQFNIYIYIYALNSEYFLC